MTLSELNDDANAKVNQAVLLLDVLEGYCGDDDAPVSEMARTVREILKKTNTLLDEMEVRLRSVEVAGPPAEKSIGAKVARKVRQ